jgi:2-keto-4-pentenoate hydratase/2-oxohepta-3-ene-1,7-dioic acid hydratase in catechol pathway
VALVDGSTAWELPADAGLIEVAMGPRSAEQWRERSVAVHPLDSLVLLSPIEPASFRDFMTFEQHVEGVRRGFGKTGPVEESWYLTPTFYFSNPHSFVGHGAEVPITSGSTRFDFELEIAVIVGRDGIDLTIEEAATVIAGYAILNDWTARDIQRVEMLTGFGPCKSKDSVTTLGPWVVTPDELNGLIVDDHLRIRATARVNGRTVGSDWVDNMAWSFPQLISHASRGAWVRAGDVIASGTIGGGCLAEWWGRHGSMTPAPLAPGDIVELEVDRLGTLVNQVGASGTAYLIPSARRVDPGRWGLTRGMADTQST